MHYFEPVELVSGIKTLTAEDARRLDALAEAEFRLPGRVLMENAGRGAAELVFRLLKSLDAKPGAIANPQVAICCGKGNNGGDGYVIARHLNALGVDVSVLSAVNPDDLKGDAYENALAANQAKIEFQVPTSRQEWDNALKDADLIIDGLLGTGLKGPIKSEYATAISAINGSQVKTLAIDVPSGMSAETGIVAGPGIYATWTATFVAPKSGFLNPEAARYLGRIYVLPIGIPRSLMARFGL